MSNILVKMVQRTDTSERWETYNPVLMKGEIGYDTDKKAIKIGDGVSKWKELSFYSDVIDGGEYNAVSGN